MKRITIITTITIIFILLILFFILRNIGFIDYLDRGSAYFSDDDRYHHSTSLTKDEYSMTIDMNNLDEYSDKIVIRNDLFNVRMRVIEIDDESNIMMYFYIESHYNFYGGKIVYIYDMKQQYNKDFVVTTDLDNENSTKVIASGPFHKDGYGAGISIRFEEDVDLSNYDTITFTFKNLIINHYDRN